MKASLLIALLAFVASSAHAGAGAAAQKAEVCAACHGADFNTPVSEDIPRLAGQYPDYLARALADYKSGARKNALMNGQAEGLSAQDI
ncbi:MAG: cytochrome C, partial [Candidatus Accumulibacter phosphatis]|nr:cytochrome C [Candidatus Accumulibacter phosphatis]